MKTWLLFAAVGPLAAQSLQILPAPPSASQSRTFQIMHVSPAAAAPAALQWRLSTFEGVFAGDDIQIAGTAGEANKSLQCKAATENKGATSAYICVLYGGVSPIPDGPIVVVRVTPAPGMPLKIRLSEILGATPQSNPVRYADVESTISAPHRRVP